MSSGSELAKSSCHFLGIPYSKLDCQAFVEKSLSEVGISKNLAGSNTWFRFLMKEGWTGTPEECRKIFGSIPPGAFLFILSQNGKEPEKYRGDGIGNASHIGIYTGMTGDQMVDIAEASGDTMNPRDCNYGSGAIHSSSSRGKVCTSSFAGKSINGGWNRIGLWKLIQYGEPFDSFLNGQEVETMTATTWARNGTTVNLRKSKNTGSALIDRIPIGQVVEVTDQGDEWCGCTWKGKSGYIMTQYLIFGEVVPGENEAPASVPEGMIMVNQKELEQVYDMIGNLLGRRG